MKEFEKWLDNYTTCGQTGVEVANDAWKAALGWVKDTVVHQSDGPSSPEDLIQCIDEELNDESTNSKAKNKN